MKKYLILFASILTFQVGYAQDENDSSSLEDIINQQSQVNQINYSDSHYRNIWGKTTYLDLSLNNAKMSMTDVNGTEQKSKLSFGLTWGNSYKFHKRPIGNVLFIGLDYTWIDLHYANFDNCSAWTSQCKSDDLPWGNKMNLIDYGMALGPQISVFPFTSLRKKGLDPIRVQLFYHVGYNVKLAMLKDVTSGGEKMEHAWDSYAWGHGLYMECGVNLDWNFIGLGYSHRWDNCVKFKPISSDFDHTIKKFDEVENRIYLQFRF